jgi:hypothetical protein
MQLAVTVSRDADINDLKGLIDALRQKMSDDQVTILEAPTGFDYAFSLPIVVVEDGPEQGRHFGPDAVNVLRRLAA